MADRWGEVLTSKEQHDRVFGVTELFFILSMAVDTGFYAFIKTNKGKRGNPQKNRLKYGE